MLSDHVTRHFTHTGHVSEHHLFREENRYSSSVEDETLIILFHLFGQEFILFVFNPLVTRVVVVFILYYKSKKRVNFINLSAILVCVSHFLFILCIYIYKYTLRLLIC